MSFNNKFTTYYAIDIEKDTVENNNDSDFISHVEKFVEDKLSTLYFADTNRVYVKKDDTTQVVGLITSLLNSNDIATQNELTKKIAKRLLSCEKNVQEQISKLLNEVQSGGLIISHFESNGEEFICIIKIHYIDFYEKKTFQRNTGLPEKHVILKTCINRLEKNKLGGKFLLSDSTKSKGAETAKFWWNDFLELDTKYTDKDNTNKSFEMFDNQLKKDYYDVDREDYWYLRNNLVSYYQTVEEFKINDLIERTIGNMDLNVIEKEIEPYNEKLKSNEINEDEYNSEVAEYKKNYKLNLKQKFEKLSIKKNGERLFDTEFIIASREIKARIKRKIKLVENIDLEIKGNVPEFNDTIITGIDETRPENEKKFIKIYTNNGYDTFKTNNG